MLMYPFRSFVYYYYLILRRKALLAHTATRPRFTCAVTNLLLLNLLLDLDMFIRIRILLIFVKLFDLLRYDVCSNDKLETRQITNTTRNYSTVRKVTETRHHVKIDARVNILPVCVEDTTVTSTMTVSSIFLCFSFVLSLYTFL